MKLNKNKRKKVYNQLESIISASTLLIYLLISFITKAWHITWIIWILYVIVMEIIKFIMLSKYDD